MNIKQTVSYDYDAGILCLANSACLVRISKIIYVLVLI
jgi:hypothetical protein